MFKKIGKFLFGGPAPETIAEKIARSISQNGESAPAVLRLSPFNQKDRQRLFKVLPIDYKPSDFGVEQIEFPNLTREQVKNNLQNWLEKPAASSVHVFPAAEKEQIIRYIKEGFPPDCNFISQAQFEYVLKTIDDKERTIKQDNMPHDIPILKPETSDLSHGFVQSEGSKTLGLEHKIDKIDSFLPVQNDKLTLRKIRKLSKGEKIEKPSVTPPPPASETVAKVPEHLTPETTASKKIPHSEPPAKTIRTAERAIKKPSFLIEQDVDWSLSSLINSNQVIQTVGENEVYFSNFELPTTKISLIRKNLNKMFGKDNVKILKGGTGNNYSIIKIQASSPDSLREVVEYAERIKWEKRIATLNADERLNLASEHGIHLDNENVVNSNLKKEYTSETSDLRIGVVRSNQGEIVELAPTIGGIETTETAEAALARTSVKKPLPTTEAVKPAPHSEPPAKTISKPIRTAERAIKKPSFLSRFWESEEKFIRPVKIPKAMTLALVGTSVAILLGAMMSARKYENELQELEKENQPNNSWLSRLQTERQKAAMHSGANITNL